MTDAVTTVLESPHDAGRLEADRYISLRVGQDFVSLTDSILKKGTNGHSGKSYARFSLNSCLILKKKQYKDGTPRYHAYLKTGKTRYSPSNFQDVTPKIGTTSGHFAGNTEQRAIAIAAFFRAIDHDALPMGTEFLKLAYPMLNENPAWRWAPGMGTALRKSDTRSFIEAAFGKTRYRKDLVKAVAASNSLEKVAQARVWRGIVPIDWIVDGIAQSVPSNRILDNAMNLAHLRKLLPMVDQGSRKRLLMQSMTNDRGSHFMSDTLRSVDTIFQSGDSLEYIGRVDGWRSLHDTVATQARLAVNANRPVPQSAEVYKILDGVSTSGGLTLVSAKDTDDLIYWGGQMNNCIGSYSHEAVNSSTCLFGIYDKEDLVGNMEVDPTGRVQQIVGKFNSPFQRRDEVRDALEAAIKEKGSKSLVDSATKAKEPYVFQIENF